MERMPAVEVVVIGGGVIGCAVAYELAKAGVSVAIVEAGEVASVASGASAGGVRQQRRDPRELPIAIRAIQRWPSLERELEADLHYRQDGNLTLIEREEDLPELARRVEAERAAGLEVRVVAGDELRRLAPGLSPRVVAGSWCPSDGHAMPILTTKAFARAAVALGARLYEWTPVTGVTVAAGRVAAVETPAGALPCRWVVNAAGAWSPEIARLVGIELPIETRALQMMLTAPLPPLLKPVLGCVGRLLSLKQLPSGSYLIGGGWPGAVHQERRFGAVRIESMAGSAEHASAVFPPLRRGHILRAWTGLEAITVDEAPILGPAPGVEGFLLACGFSGHGFALAPYVGVLTAELITTGRTSLPIEPLGYGRFQAA